MLGYAKQSWTLVSIEAIDRNDNSLQMVTLGFKLQCKTGGSHNFDLSRAVVKFEDLFANLIFHGYINDMHANVHFHLKLFYSEGYWVARGKKTKQKCR
jgi:hypothetical protein